MTSCRIRMPCRTPRSRQNHWFGSRRNGHQARPPHTKTASHPPTITNPTKACISHTVVVHGNDASMAPKTSSSSSGAVADGAEPPHRVLVEPPGEVQPLQRELERGRRHAGTLLLDAEPTEQLPEPGRLPELF